MQNMYSEGPLLVVTMVERTGEKTQGVKIERASGKMLIYDFSHPGR